MRKNLIILYLLCGISCMAQRIPFPRLAFGKGVTAVYTGSGAGLNYLDRTRFQPQTEMYRRSPFLSIGFDRCILPYASNAYWGFGPYVSSWLATRTFSDLNENRRENTWSSTLLAFRATHHNTYFVREKLDMCAGILVGTRFIHYYSQTLNDKEDVQPSDKTTFSFAAGLTFTVRYYFYKNIGCYVDGCLGYKTDVLGLGLVYKIH